MGVIRPYKPMKASLVHLSKFHDPDYLSLLQSGPPPSLSPKESLDLLDSYNLVDDCELPPTPSGLKVLWNYVTSVAGASIHAASLLTPYGSTPKRDSAGRPVRDVRVALNWGGGRHHARLDGAGGFCYVNDAVLAAQYMRRKFGKVLYLDIDIHHADGVEEAFRGSWRVVTVSLHKFHQGFFPGTGEAGVGSGGAELNIPLPDGVTDADFKPFYESVFDTVFTINETHCRGGAFKAVVLAVGADGLHGDPVVGRDGWSLSTHGLAGAVAHTARRCREMKVPLLVLGGGGYDDVNATRAFGICTVAACEGVKPGVLSRLPPGAPEGEYFHRYGPTFSLHTSPTERGTYGGTDVGRGRRRVEGGMEDARGVLGGWKRIVEGKVDGGFRYDEEGGGEEGNEDGEMSKDGMSVNGELGKDTKPRAQDTSDDGGDNDDYDDADENPNAALSASSNTDKDAE
ncbi:hypothetical protein TrCOL_g6212 [Triparma columacea]|uniref:Histone deacetylase domain-containing protein n=1 Tax=Triparma columacea TaxID=722753 RepID=A0A9W7GS23_9STRA|nr:hypothetical protein TrCOL_g6212 [Triparma columacea]